MKLTANPASGSLSPHKWDGGFGAKFLRVMKLTTIIILVACLHTSANGLAQQTVTFSGKEVRLENVFNAIKKQTSYRFFFNTNMLQQASKVSIDVRNAPIEQVMALALKDQQLTYTIKGRTIFIMKKVEEQKSSHQFALPTGDPITVSGKVTDDKGQPLVGANVKVKGSNTGVVTDNQGRFSLPNVDPNATLEISFVGHETQLLAVRGKSLFTVALGQKEGILDETVVIAYGTTTRRFSTGNVSSVKASDIEKQPVNNPLLALQGRVPGLTITQSSGVPGSGITVRIQGQNSLLNGSDPLYVIDGVPYPSQFPSTGLDGILGSGSSGGRRGGGFYGSGNPLSYINPADIESIEVLKDADATAIYGSKAANGAILITTKKGKIGKIKLDLNLQQGWGKVTRKLDMLKTEQYLEMRREAFYNDGVNPNPNRDYDLLMWDTTRYTDWQKELIGGTSEYSNINVSVSGGSPLVQYLVGGTWLRETTVFPGNFNDTKASMHFNINSSSSNQKFYIKFSGNYLVDNNRLPNKDLTNKALLLEPNAPPLFDSNSMLNWALSPSGSVTFDNPLQYLHNIYENKTSTLVGNTQLAYSILPKLEVRSSFGYTNIQTNDFQGTPLISIRPDRRSIFQRSAFYGNRSINSWIIEPQANYRIAVGKGKLNLLVGATIQQENNNGNTIYAEGFRNDQVLKDINSAATISRNGSFITVYKYMALFGRINYNWNDKYIVNLTARRDGTSRFGEKNRLYNFGAIGFGWIFSNEKFINKNIPFLTFGKIRGSYGTSGSDQIRDYQYMNLFNTITSGVAYQSIVGIGPTGLTNPYLEWEETRKLQIGIDVGFLSDRILFSTTFVRNRSSNQLLTYALPSITGFGSISENFPATIQNSSAEFSLNTVNIKSKTFTWSSNLNLTIPKNKLVSFPDMSLATTGTGVVIGQPLGVIQTYRLLNVDSETGKYLFADSVGDATFTPTEKDKIVFINTSSKFYGGFQNTFSYRNFELDILFQFVKQIGANLANYNGNTFPGRFTNGFSNQPITVLDRWQKTGDVASVQKFSTSTIPFSLGDIMYTDASYLRLKNLSLSYQLPSKWKKKAHLENCKVFLHAQNILTLTSYKGMDPENQGNISLPPLRIWTIGFRAEL